MFGSLDVHTAAVFTFTGPAVSLQTARSPARGALHVSASRLREEEPRPVKTPPTSCSSVFTSL
jgi:hypothetical protein